MKNVFVLGFMLLLFSSAIFANQGLEDQYNSRFTSDEARRFMAKNINPDLVNEFDKEIPAETIVMLCEGNMDPLIVNPIVHKYTQAQEGEEDNKSMQAIFESFRAYSRSMGWYGDHAFPERSIKILGRAGFSPKLADEYPLGPILSVLLHERGVSPTIFNNFMDVSSKQGLNARASIIQILKLLSANVPPNKLVQHVGYNPKFYGDVICGNLFK